MLSFSISRTTHDEQTSWNRRTRCLHGLRRAARRRQRVVATAGHAPVRWYRLTESDDGHPDDPAYFFKKISSTSYPASTKLTVELVLKKEMAAKSKK
jgi:hypothetical protein